MKTTVWVVKPKDRDQLQLQWRDPMTGKRKTKSAGTTIKRDAQRAAGRLEAELRDGTYRDQSKITWQVFRERYDDEQLSGLADQTARKVFGVFASLERHLGLTGATKLHEVTAERLSHYQSLLRKAGRSESTIAAHHAHLQAAFRWAAKIGLIPKAPDVAKPKRTKGGKVMKGRPIKAEEFERMLEKVEFVVGATAAPSWRRYLQGLWWSGLRLEESLNLYWDRPDRLCVDLSGRRPMLRIPAELEKGHRDRLLPVAPEFTQFLLETPERERRGRVFRPQPQRERGGPLTVTRVGRAVSAIGKAAGVKVNVDAKSGKVKFASAHDLRRAFGERWSSRVMPQVLMELMRHESIETTLRYYVGRDAQTTADAVWRAFEQQSPALNQALNNSTPSESHQDESSHASFAAAGS